MTLLKRIFGRGAAAAPDREAIEGWVREGFQRHVERRFDEAQDLFRKVLEHDPRHADALFFLGSVAAQDGRELEAIELFERAIDARPIEGEFRFALGLTLFNAGRYAAAEPYFREAVRLRPDHTAAVGNLWMTDLELGREEEVRIACERELAAGRQGTYIDVNLATIYRTQGQIDEAIAAARRVFERSPHSADALSNLLLTLLYSESYTPKALYEEHRKFAAQFARPYLAPPPDLAWPRKLRIGYVSPDFRAHVVALFFEPILERHDRERFEIFCYYNHRVEDPFTERLRGYADQWRDCVHLSDAELAERIRADRIDILVDLAGHTGYNRLRVFAMKPAPVQANYLGYPSTTGLAAIDYRISDARADPPGAADQMSAERVARLPACFHTFRPLEDSPEVGPLPAASAGHVTFGCLNNFAKLSDGFFDAAARVLLAVPGSRLLLKGKPLGIARIAERVRQRFARSGVGAERLELIGWRKTPGDHLAVYNEIDIALDSFPYQGTTTTCEALWMGVPVVALAGDRHAARVGVSLLHAVGLDDWIAEDVEGYAAIAARLAADLQKLGSVRAGLRERVRQSALRDEAGLTRAIEESYLEMWRAKTSAAPEQAMGAAQVADAVRRADVLRREGRVTEASELYKGVLVARPDHIESLTAMWDILFDAGNPGSTVDWLNRAIAVRGDVAEFHYMLGCCLQAQRKTEDAVTAFSRAVELDPRHARAYNNLGGTLEAAGNLGGAFECYGRALELNPALAVAAYNKGNALRQNGDADNAIASMRAALAIDPKHADWRCNLGDLLFGRLELDEALACYRAAIGLEASYARGWLGQGMSLQGLGRADEAEASLRRAIALDPKLAQAGSNLLLVLHNRHGDDPERMFAEHAAWAKRHADRVPWQAVRTYDERRRPGRLRIAYLSGDFCQHPVAGFIEPVLAAHDRKRFQVFCYSTTSRPDAVTRRLEGLCEHWRDVAGDADELIAERMRYDGIDVLVDLAGHTAGGRLALLACKPAPVQVSWLGYPNTTGLHAVDYRLTDARADPPGDSDRFHAEKLARLPHAFLCYRPPAGAPDPAEPPARAAGHVTFGSLNNLSKITDETVALWARILARTPGSRMLLKAYGLAAAGAREDIVARFARHGIEAARLTLLPPVPGVEAHLAAYAQVDLALDTFPYNGTTTTLEALWMGVPVVTRAGRTHVSRVGLSLLTAAGLADLATTDADGYVDKAVALAADPARLAALRREQRGRLRASPLLDEKAFTLNLESAYLDCWAAYVKEEEKPPMRLHIGGNKPKDGWKILDIQPGPGVDYVGDCSDLSRFPDQSVDEIYASHVVEHLGYKVPMKNALTGFHRVLKPGGCARISVPDFGFLVRKYLDPRYSFDERFYLMQMMFGGQADAHDFHHVGLDYELLGNYLTAAGFSRVERVGEFGLFDDDSTALFRGEPISLNVIAYK